MQFEVNTNGPLQAYSLPWTVFRQAVIVRANGLKAAEEIELDGARFWGGFPELPGIQWPPMALAIEPNRLSQDRRVYVDLLFPFDRRLVRAIEDWRQGRAVPIRMEVHLDLYYRKVREHELPLPSSAKEQQSFGVTTIGRERQNVVTDISEIGSKQVQLGLTVAYDQWVAALKAMGWDELEVFEVPVLAMKDSEILGRGLECLRSAQLALRNGHWSAAVTEARKACEAAAGVAAPDEGDHAKAFDILLGQVLPDEHDDAKRKALSSIMLGISKLRHKAAHGGDIRVQIDRRDAELAVTAVVSVFRYMGEALADREGKP